jgi:RNA polymerase sigma-54 factor
MQRLTQQQRLMLKLSPQQIQLMKLLQVPTAQLEERIKEEIEENPALEFDGEDSADSDIEYKDGEEPSANNDADDEIDYSSDDSGDEFEHLDLSDYIKEEDGNEYSYQEEVYNGTRSDDVPSERNVAQVESSFVEDLMGQLQMLGLTEHQIKVAEQVIGSIDDDGYLRREVSSIVDDLSFRQNIISSDVEVLTIINIIQSLDPAGICARNLQECLRLQLKRKQPSIVVRLALKVVDKYFNEISKKHYSKIQKALDVDDDLFKQVVTYITKLNPRPGGGFADGSKIGSYIMPDYFVEQNNGKLTLTLNANNAPELRVSTTYKEMLRDYEKKQQKDPKQKDAVFFIKQKLDSARWFIDAIKQRQNTLMLTMDTILKYQEAFFYSGDETDIRPMILKDIAQRTGLDISTVSRVANSKYVQTEFGTYALKFFFSEGMATTDGGEEVSTKEVKKILQDLVAAENKTTPISDDDLAKELNKKGYNIARRTVAKYREQLNIPVARLRKEL